jgi:two-component system, NtrC family, response regulator HydG
MPDSSPSKARVLIVDDERPVAEGLRDILAYDGYAVDVATSPDEALARLHKALYDLALLDLRLGDHMEDLGGIEMLEICRQVDPAIAVLILTAFGSLETARRAFRLGAKDFLAKPIRRHDLLAAVERALDASRIARELRALRQRTVPQSSFAVIVGSSSKLLQELETARTVAPSDLAVVIQGETGTGKDLLATALHEASPRSSAALVTAVIGAVPDELQKSALFGHVAGAFTGAKSSHRGFFQEAHRGTLFLDEIGDISLETQVALLRVLEKKLIRPVGADHEVNVDVRIVAATNRDLRKAVHDGLFREDLYYRLGGIFLTMPPLRERREDIPALVATFARRFVGKEEKVPHFEPEAIQALAEYRWPGNVRELKNVVERAILLAGSGTVRRNHCLLEPVRPAPADFLDAACEVPLREATDRFTAAYLARLLHRNGGDLAKVADQAGYHVTHIRRLIRALHATTDLIEGHPSL